MKGIAEETSLITLWVPRLVGGTAAGAVARYKWRADMT